MSRPPIVLIHFRCSKFQIFIVPSPELDASKFVELKPIRKTGPVFSTSSNSSVSLVFPFTLMVMSSEHAAIY